MTVVFAFCNASTVFVCPPVTLANGVVFDAFAHLFPTQYFIFPAGFDIAPAGYDKQSFPGANTFSLPHAQHGWLPLVEDGAVLQARHQAKSNSPRGLLGNHGKHILNPPISRHISSHLGGREHPLDGVMKRRSAKSAIFY